MSRSTNRDDGAVVREFLSIADLLEDPQLAQPYAYLARENEATVQELIDVSELAQGTAYSYVNRLVDPGLVEATREAQPRTYLAREIELTVTAADEGREYTITPALIDAVWRRTTDDIDTYIDRHGIDGPASALTYAVARERGEVTHPVRTRDPDISPLADEFILRALRPVVHEHVDVEAAGGAVEDIDGVDRDATDDDA